ncbi:TetR/AcrR family transcriptional regulator [Ollibium composti]|uniref:TetR/AcrR family transcriptional regulator n=1 Tax=Ollibium composti TaxID=2675109 RepID=A0ABY2QF20_9HYPH|nr:TetR/AcrR family transcriptional regulator [Mesorhizobium composti]THF59796.1 TetR/AcrR family transcriptional regulator [Mesorhizobium composti]
METLLGNLQKAIDGEAAAMLPCTRPERRERQVQRILEAAKACFVRAGFQGASMHDICTEAGMSPGALYRYFASKEAIIAAICEADRREDATLFKAVTAKADVIEGMVLGAMTHIRHMHESRAAPLFAEICAEAARNNAVESTCRCHVEQVQAMFRAYLGEAMDRGEIDPAVELDVVVPTLLAIINGMALNDLPARGVPLEKLETLVRATLIGILRPTGQPGEG